MAASLMPRRTEIAGLFIVILWLASPTIAQTSQAFSAAKSFPDPIGAASFEFSIGDYLYRIAENGKGRRTSNEKSLSFNLRIQPNDYLTRELYYLQHKGDLLIICEVSDEESGMGIIARLDGATLRMKWKRIIPGFNVGQGLLDGAFAYVTGIGFVGKVNLKTGAYEWRHTDLYGQANSAFNAFALPKVERNVVVFREAAHYLRKKTAVIRVQRHKGKIISIIT